MCQHRLVLKKCRRLYVNASNAANTVRDYENFTYTIFWLFFNVLVPVQNRHLQVENLSHVSDLVSLLSLEACQAI
jgi:hypothetical protein